MEKDPTSRLYETKLSASDFDAGRCERHIQETEDASRCSSLFFSFQNVCRQYMDEEDWPQAKIFLILSLACSLRLENGKGCEPMAPMYTGSYSLAECTEEHLDFYAGVLPSISHPVLAARLADLLWIKRKNISYARNAVDNYMRTGISKSTFYGDKVLQWHRAIDLIRGLKDAGRQKTAMESLSAAFRSAEAQERYFAAFVADLMEYSRFFTNERTSVAERLESLALSAAESGDYRLADAYFMRAEKWYKAACNADAAAEVDFQWAEALLKEAENVSPLCKPDNLLRALDLYRSIPKKKRAAYGVDATIHALEIGMKEAGKQAVKALHQYSIPVDLRGLQDAARREISGKSLDEALEMLVCLPWLVCVEDLEKEAEEQIKEHPFLALFPTSVITLDGRSVTPHGKADKKQARDPRTEQWMLEIFRMKASYCAAACIAPALEVIKKEHKVEESYIREKVRRMPFLPSDRVGQFSKGLHSGLFGDFIPALHILSAQLENLIRIHIKKAGGKTTAGSGEGQTELPIGGLVDLPEMREVFGNDCTYAVKALFCAGLGPNLKNDIFHGLMDDTDFYNPISIYAWWFIFALLFRQYFQHTTENG